MKVFSERKPSMPIRQTQIRIYVEKRVSKSLLSGQYHHTNFISVPCTVHRVAIHSYLHTQLRAKQTLKENPRGYIFVLPATCCNLGTITYLVQMSLESILELRFIE